MRWVKLPTVQYTHTLHSECFVHVYMQEASTQLLAATICYFGKGFPNSCIKLLVLFAFNINIEPSIYNKVANG